ncbi:MAG: hypothetical protein ACXAEF_10395, partial [Candidatus Thorarchaeota archaeon]
VMRAIGFMIPLILLVMIPVYDTTFGPCTGYRGGNGHLTPGKTRICHFETAGGQVRGNVTVDIVPIYVWIIPYTDYNSMDSFSTDNALYSNLGIFSSFDFDSSHEKDLILIMFNNSNENQTYDYIIEYEFPLEIENVIPFTQGILSILILPAVLLVAIVYLVRRRA